jgi:mannose-6-phosphate isomerase-like protein (cupin superfamily)
MQAAAASRLACIQTLGVGNTIHRWEILNMDAINLAAKLTRFTEHWQPRTVGQFNGHDLMVVKGKGEFVWHKHDDTDDFFLFLKGRLTIRMRDRNV